jgi:hypothetical protein
VYFGEYRARVNVTLGLPREIPNYRYIRWEYSSCKNTTVTTGVGMKD